MSAEQLFFAQTGVIGLLAGFFKYYLDVKIDGAAGPLTAKIDGLAKQVDLLVKYMVDHESRVSRLEERTK